MGGWWKGSVWLVEREVLGWWGGTEEGVAGGKGWTLSNEFGLQWKQGV